MRSTLRETVLCLYGLAHLYTELVLKLKVLTQYVLEIGWYPAIAINPPDLIN
ncbi:MAG: hypothetical protein ICV54_16205 [Nostoc sp. C3-bin3]|nr:hypothetical protein [Nostoc sp. C3-bin3]